MPRIRPGSRASPGIRTSPPMRSTTAGACVLFDPLAPPRELEELAAEREAAIVLTCPWHERDSRSLVERLGTPVYTAPPDSAQYLMDTYGISAERAGDGSPDVVWLLKEGIGEARLYAAGDRLDVGAEAFPGHKPNDLVLWIESHGAVIAGDTLADLGRRPRDQRAVVGPGRDARRTSPQDCGRCSSCRSSTCSPRTAARSTGPLWSARSPSCFVSEHEPDAEHQVTPLELFFDLTFVFAMTQVTAMLADDPTWRGRPPRDARARGALVGLERLRLADERDRRRRGRRAAGHARGDGRHVRRRAVRAGRVRRRRPLLRRRLPPRQAAASRPLRCRRARRPRPPGCDSPVCADRGRRPHPDRARSLLRRASANRPLARRACDRLPRPGR